MTSQTRYFSSVLASFDGVRHGFSQRADGDMRLDENRRRYADSLMLDGARLRKPKQVHSNVIGLHGDGIVSKNAPICIITADCVPLLAVDAKNHVIGAAHAGWKGTLDNIAANLINAMVSLGAQKKNISVALGPCIGMSCYNVPEERAMQFASMFGSKGGVTEKTRETWHLDIGRANFIELEKAGILPDNIEVLPICTSCNPDTLFSYRKNAKEKYGEMVAVIGFT